MTYAAAAPAHAGLALARGAALGVAALALPVAGVAGLAHGPAGVAAASAGLGLVLVLFGAAALAHVWASRLSPRAFAGVVLAGLGGRVALYTVVLAALSHVEGLHWPSLAAATGIGVVGTLAVELWLLARRPELFWVRTDRTAQSEGARR